MERLLSGSILLGFGTLASIAYHWADTVACSVPLYQVLLVNALILGGIVLMAAEVRERHGIMTESGPTGTRRGTAVRIGVATASRAYTGEQAVAEHVALHSTDIAACSVASSWELLPV